MIVQHSVFAVMVRQPETGDWMCLGVSHSEEAARHIAAEAVDNITLSYSFHPDRVQRGVAETLETIKVIPAVLGYHAEELLLG